MSGYTSSVRRREMVRRALSACGGKASTRTIAEALGWNVNGVAQTLGRMTSTDVECLGGRGGDTMWRLRR